MGHEHSCFIGNALKMCDLWKIFGEWFIDSMPQLKKKKVFSSVVETEVIKHYFYILKMLKDVKIKCGPI